MKKTFMVLMTALVLLMLFVSCDGNADDSASRVGQKGEAGVIFYDKGSYSNGWRYLEADTQDINGKSFGQKGKTYNCSGSGIGDGKTNTETLASASENQNEGNAAYACLNLVRNVDETKYDDWFLPSTGEFAEMRKYKDKIGLGNTDYWTSTEANDDQGYVYANTSDSGQYGQDKNETKYSVRAVRAF